MVNLITGPRGSGKTQQMIDLANEKVKTSNGNVVLIKKSHKDTYTVDFNIRAIRMADYKDILTLEEFVGFLYGMVAGNHDICLLYTSTIYIGFHRSVINIFFYCFLCLRCSKRCCQFMFRRQYLSLIHISRPFCSDKNLRMGSDGRILLWICFRYVL